jgi:two-component system sensor histidine kinase UhpB
MPLRIRLIASVGLVLLVSLACGSVLVGWRAANSVRTELRAALDVGSRAIRDGIAELVRDDRVPDQTADRAAAARQLVARFNGNRHARATLLDRLDRPLATSQLFVPAQPAPEWFRDLIGGDPGAVRFPVPASGENAGAIVLRADPINEIGEVWAESRDAVLVLAGFATLSTLLICAVVARALRPLEALSNAFERIGEGQYHGGLAEHGPPELARLAVGFNAMTRRLATAAARNRRLNERLLTAQAEERADLARDLHDEIGPLLFAVDMTAATIGRLAGAGQTAAIAAHARFIQDGIGRMQRHVRSLLERLRPIEAIGLEAAIRRLAEFWRDRRPDIAFAIDVSADEDRIGDGLREAIYRIVQEGMTNAIRHGNPTRVDIVVAHDHDGLVRVAVTDDGIGMAADGSTRRDPGQLGLIGMRERVMAMAGTLSVRHGSGGRGLALIASLPCVTSLQYENAGEAE